jgi:peptide/nickel transport system permease protein
VPLISTTIAYVVGASLGMFGGYAGGLTDRIVARVLDLLLSLPGLLIVLVLIAGLGRSTLVLTLSVAVVFIAGSGRVVRAATQTVVSNDYISAAQARGERTVAILGREVLPNIAGPMIADYSVRLTWAILFVATLNFLGLGQQPPSSDWGLMVSQGSTYLSFAPVATLVPAAGIVALAVSFNLVADALARHLTPDATARETAL